MSLVGTINGATIPTGRIRLHTAEDEGISGLIGSADGQGSQGAITFDDPDHSLVLQGFDYITIDETDCTDAPRLFTGYLADRTTAHGKYPTDGGRQIDATINDPNTLLTWLLITGTDGKRPAETRAERLDWLMASAYWPPNVFDVGWIFTGVHEFEEADYRRQYAADVLSDILETYQTFFVKWDPVTEQLGLFYGAANSTLLTSPLTISNDMADVDFDVCFPPLIDGSLHQEPGEVYSLVDLEYTGGDIRQEDTGVTAQFFSTVGPRGVAVNESRIGKLATAQHFITAYLAQDATEDATVSCSLILPSTHVGLLSEGDRVSAKFLHLDGYEDFTWTRVKSKTLRTLEGRRDLYLLTLELNDKGPFGGGGGGGGTSNPPPTTFPPGPPHDLHWYFGTFPVHGDTGWVAFSAYDEHGNQCAQLTTAELEISGGYTYDISVVWEAGSYAKRIAFMSDSLSPTAPIPLNFNSSDMPDGANSQHFTGSFTAPDAGHIANVYRIRGECAESPHAHDLMGTVTFWIDPDGWVVDDPQPLTPGQQNLRPEFVTMSGADGTTLWPFADNTLKVFVDNLDETAAITAQDGAAGTFTLGFTRTSTEIVRVEYQGR